MLPSCSLNYPCDSSDGNTVVIGEFPYSPLPRIVKPSDLLNLIDCQFSPFMRFPMWSSLSSLFSHILTVLFFSANEQMAWTATDWIVTFVKNTHSGWDGSIRKHPRHSMSAVHFLVKPILTIALSIKRCEPSPASIINCLKNIRPKWVSIHKSVPKIQQSMVMSI